MTHHGTPIPPAIAQRAHELRSQGHQPRAIARTLGLTTRSVESILTRTRPRLSAPCCDCDEPIHYTPTLRYPHHPVRCAECAVAQYQRETIALHSAPESSPQ